MYLTYRDRTVKSVVVFYKGDIPGSLTHTTPLEDRSKLQIDDINLQLIDKYNF